MSSAVQIHHQDRIPESGCLVVPGCIDFHELLYLQRLFEDRKITWLIEENAELDPAVEGFLSKTEHGAAFSNDDKNPVGAGKQLAESLENGGVLIHIHGKAAARAATPCHIPGKTLATLGAFGLPTLPLVVDYPRESALSIERVNKLPRAVIAVGHLIPKEKSSGSALRQALLETFEEVYSTREIFKTSLATALLEGLKKHRSCKLFDGSDDSSIGFDRLMAAALVFSRYLRSVTDNPRIGIILPPGKAGLVANLAVVFAGRTPVNFNFTASHDAIRSAMRQAKTDCYITADPFVRKVTSFPWPPNRDLIFIERELPTLKPKIVLWAVLAKFLPTCVLKQWFRIGRRKGDDEAALLFTSGSSGEPKGVPLTHRNLLGNVCQFSTRLAPNNNSSILGALPLFHSFGCTVTLWFPVIEGLDLVTYPNPLETKRLGQLIEQHHITYLLATPTFLRGYMKRVKPEQLASLKLIITGAEKLPQSLADTFQKRFGHFPYEGYGLTETSPATNVNLPDPVSGEAETVIPASRPGSVGHLLPGLAIRLTDPATDQSCQLHQQGIIWLKGVNIFAGYLNDTKRTEEVLTKDGWFRTGDVGRVDEDGFLYIEGRISRFSKIAGEMVPHETVEASINQALGLDSETERKIAVVGVPDEQKGEAILLLSTVAGRTLEQECIDLRYKLLDAGVPSLWCPRAIVPVDEIPVLASGKLDIKACQELAKE